MLYFVSGLILCFVFDLILYFVFSWCCISQKGGAGNKGRVSETRHWPKRLHNKGWAFQNVWDSFCVTQILGAEWSWIMILCLFSQTFLAKQTKPQISIFYFSALHVSAPAVQPWSHILKMILSFFQRRCWLSSLVVNTSMETRGVKNFCQLRSSNIHSIFQQPHSKNLRWKWKRDEKVKSSGKPNSAFSCTASIWNSWTTNQQQHILQHFFWKLVPCVSAVV